MIFTQVKEKDAYAMQLIGYVGTSISLVCLLLTILIFGCFKSVLDQHSCTCTLLSHVTMVPSEAAPVGGRGEGGGRGGDGDGVRGGGDYYVYMHIHVYTAACGLSRLTCSACIGTVCTCISI